MEKYLDWIIDEKDVANWFFSGSIVKLEADIYPNIEELYKFLQDNNIVSTPFQRLIKLIEYAKYAEYAKYEKHSYLYASHDYFSIDEKKDLTILNAIAEFCNLNRYKTKKSSHAILDTGSNERTTRRAMNKIKKWIRETLPNPRQELINYLKKEKLITNDINPFCEILSKDI